MNFASVSSRAVLSWDESFYFQVFRVSRSRFLLLTRGGFDRVASALLGLIGALVFAAFVSIAPAQAAAPNCPPGACVDVEKAATLKAALKREMARAGVPPRLTAMVDDLPDCEDCIRASRLSIVSVYDRAVGNEILRVSGDLGDGYDYSESGSSTYIQAPWSPNSERIARANLASGRSKALHFTLLSGPCICCPENEDEARNWKAGGGALRTSVTLFNNENVSSILTAEQLGPLPRDLYELDPSLTRQALDGPAGVSELLPVTFPSLERYVSVICPQCRAMAAERNALVARYNDQREQAASQHYEGKRLLELHIAREAETRRIRALIAPPDIANPDAYVDQRNAAREREDARLLRQANAQFASSRALLAKMVTLKQQIDAFDQPLLECDQQPCADANVAIDDVIEPTETVDAADRVSQTFAAFAGLAFKSSQMSSDMDYISGSEHADGDAAVSSAAFSFGLMAYPFAGIPIYLSAEGMVFAGNDGRFYSVNLHPGPEDDTTAEGRAVWAGRVSVGVTVPIEGGCISRSACFLVDVDGGVVLEHLETTFVTDETGGGGERNSFTFNHTQWGVSVGAALSMPLCALIDIQCGAAIAPYGRVTWFPDAEESFRRTTATYNLDYEGGFDIDTQMEAGLRLILPFGPAR